MDVKNTRRTKRRRDNNVKVVYISSPVKVKTSATRFRALVQELTGRDSDVSRFVEINGADYSSETGTAFVERNQSMTRSINDLVLAEPKASHHHNQRDYSPSSSDSVFEQPSSSASFDDALMNYSQEGEGFMGMFPTNLLSFEGFELGAIGGYAAVL